MPSMIRKTEPGDVIGRCRIIRELGRGGVGTVYLATHQTLQIEVALKILSPALSLDNPALAERFIREAQMAARIRHPNVIAVMDAAHDESIGLYYIVQEYVGGGSLSWHLRNGPLPERRALEIITGIAQALIVAEENHVVHRDIKPDNIMLDGRGTAKLADLGLAKNEIESHVSLTLGGSFMGTPAYMSPEQARDAKVADTRDDIYSLGATFYECLTGQPPFSGETPYNIMSELLTKPSPKPRDLRPELSRSVDLVCQKMMAKTRALRYADPRALVQDLHHCAVVNDAGLDGLDAANFEGEAALARREAASFGVEPVSEKAVKPPRPLTDGYTPTPLEMEHGRGTTPYRAAILLILLVTAATGAFVWLGSQHVWTNMRDQVDVLRSDFQLAPLPVQKAPLKVTHTAIHHHVPAPATHAMASVAPSTETDAPPAPTNVEATPATPGLFPPLPATNLAPVPGTVAALPLTSNLVATPAVPTGLDTALVARDVAEKSLPADLLGPDGHAGLLRVRGKRDESQATPSVWTFDFFDPKAAGHARIVSVADHRVVDNGERVTYIISPYTRANVLPADIIDSAQVLQIAQQLAPTAQISGSQFVLEQRKNSASFWTVTLWAKNIDNESVELGSAVILAEKGDVISNHLHPEKLTD